MLRLVAALAAMVLVASTADASDSALLGEWGYRYARGYAVDVGRRTFNGDGTYTATWAYSGNLDTLVAQWFPGLRVPLAVGNGVYSYAVAGTWDTNGGLYSNTASVTEVTVNGLPLGQFVAALIDAAVAQQVQAAGLSSAQEAALRAQLTEQFGGVVLAITATIEAQETYAKAAYTVDSEVLLIVTDPETEAVFPFYRDLNRTSVGSSSWGSIKSLGR
jgi:hypothetical protein